MDAKPAWATVRIVRGDSAARQLRLLLYLDERRELEVPAAASRLGCTVRTVYRDLGVLERMGVPLYQEREGARPRWRLADGYRRRVNLSLSWSEMLALSAGGGLLSGLAGTLFHESALTALEKLRAALPPQLLARVTAAAPRVSGSIGSSRGYETKRELVSALLEAVERQATLVVTYRKLGERLDRARTIDPYNVHVQADGVYVFAWSHERNAGRIYLLDRISAVKATGRCFERKHDFNPSEFLHGAFGPWDGKVVAVRLRFAARIARVVAERKMHPSQRSQLRADGLLDVALEAPPSPQLKAWVRGFGADVKVLSPKSLLSAAATAPVT